MTEAGNLQASLTCTVNAILGDHNVDKQMTDSRGEVRMDHARTRSDTDGSAGCISDG